MNVCDFVFFPLHFCVDPVPNATTSHLLLFNLITKCLPLWSRWFLTYLICSDVINLPSSFCIWICCGGKLSWLNVLFVIIIRFSNSIVLPKKKQKTESHSSHESISYVLSKWTSIQEIVVCCSYCLARISTKKVLINKNTLIAFSYHWHLLQQ